MNSVRSKNLSLKYQKVKPTGCRDIEIRKFEVVAKTQFLTGKNCAKNKPSRATTSQNHLNFNISFCLVHLFSS